jgi:hypothetical protein
LILLDVDPVSDHDIEHVFPGQKREKGTHCNFVGYDTKLVVSTLIYINFFSKMSLWDKNSTRFLRFKATGVKTGYEVASGASPVVVNTSSFLLSNNPFDKNDMIKYYSW